MNFLDQIRSTVKIVTEASGDVRLGLAQLDMFTTSLKRDAVIDSAVPPTFPLKFGSLEEEVNLYAVLNLLNFGSGFRHLLHARKGEDRGAYDTMVFGVMSLYLHGVKMDDAWMVRPVDLAVFSYHVPFWKICVREI